MESTKTKVKGYVAVFRVVRKERLDDPGNFFRGPEEDLSGNDEGPWRLPRALFKWLE